MEKLREKLEQVREELSSSDEFQRSAEAQGLLESVSNVLEHPGELSFSYHRLLAERMKSAVESFEIAHPKMVGALEVIIQSLNESGI